MADIPPPPPGTPPSWTPSSTPPPVQQAPHPSYSDVPPAPLGMPGYASPSGYQMAGAAAGPSLMTQFTGPAGASILMGVISVAVPLFTTFYLPILPIFGVISAVRGIMRGQVIGGIIGLVLNIIGGFISLVASGLLLH